MNSVFKSAIALAALAAAFTSCGNQSENKTSETQSDTLTTQSTGAAMDTTTRKDDSGSMNTGTGLMASMHSSMGKMKGMTMTGDFDVDFANMMIEHHQGGIDMA